MVEKWLPIKNFPLYFVSNLGHVKSFNKPKHGKLLTPINHGRPLASGGNGYQSVFLCKNGRCQRFPIHRLVTNAFLGSCPPGKQVNHKDSNRSNNCLSNLEYVTPKENVLHSILNGRRWYNKGEQCWNAKLTRDDVIRIKRSLLLNPKVQTPLAKFYKVDPTLIWRIAHNRAWIHVSVPSN